MAQYRNTQGEILEVEYNSEPTELEINGEQVDVGENVYVLHYPDGETRLVHGSVFEDQYEKVTE